ncbi:MAG: hypothetical protein ACC660_07835 [Acidimicrobiales bacterium]
MAATTPPLLEEIEPAILAVPARRGRLTCLVDGDGVSWMDERVRFDEITSVAYATSSGRLNLVQARVERRIRLVTASGELQLDLGVRSFGTKFEDEHSAIYSTVVAAVHARVEPRLRSEALRAIAAGRTVRIGKLRLTRDDISIRGRKRLEWRQLPEAQLERRKVIVRGTLEQNTSVLCTLDMLTPGAVLLPELLAEATLPFA